MRGPIFLCASVAVALTGCGGCQADSSVDDTAAPACEEREEHAHILLSEAADAILPPYSVGIGDVDADGIGDIAYHSSEEGSVSLILGPLTGDMRQSLSNAMVVDSGSGWPRFAPMGDLDGDGAADIMFTRYPGRETFFLHGPLTGQVDLVEAEVAYPSTNGYVDVQPDVGDFNGDGMDDVLLTWDEAGGRIAVFNSPAALPLDQDAADATIIVPADAVTGTEEFTITDRADFNGDGYSDLGVTLFAELQVAILYGPLAGSIELLDEAEAVVTAPEELHDWGNMAWDYQPGGDLFGDGHETLVANDGSPLRVGDQLIYAFGGPFSGAMTIEPDATITSTRGESGEFQIAAGMDADDDGVGDLLFSYYYWDSYHDKIGSPAYLYLGPLCGDRDYDDADVKLHSDAVRGVTGARDLSGDGVDDLLLSVWEDDVTYVIHGGADLMERMTGHTD